MELIKETKISPQNQVKGSAADKPPKKPGLTLNLQSSLKLNLNKLNVTDTSI